MLYSLQSESQQRYLECRGFDETTEPDAQEDSTMLMKVVVLEITHQCFENLKLANQFLDQALMFIYESRSTTITHSLAIEPADEQHWSMKSRLREGSTPLWPCGSPVMEVSSSQKKWIIQDTRLHGVS